MSISWTDVITWLIVGSLAGSLTGLILKKSKYGYGRWSNLGIGLVGALLGGGIFKILGIEMGLSRISISVQDLLAAFLGALIFLVAIGLWKRGKSV